MDTSISSHTIVDGKTGRVWYYSESVAKGRTVACVCGASVMTFDGKTIERYAPWPTPCFGPSKEINNHENTNGKPVV